MKGRRGAKPYRGPAPFLFRLPPVRRQEWETNNLGKPSVPTREFTSTSRYPPSDREGTNVGGVKSHREVTSTVVERRADMPVIRKRELGAMSLAVDAARSSKSRKEALQDLERDMYARTSYGPREALLATWDKFHVLWLGDQIPLLPLTEEKLIKVTSSDFFV